MPDQRLTDMVVATTPLDGTELYYTVQGGVDRQTTGTAVGSLPNTLFTATSNLGWFVATTGSDSNPGTVGSPFLTIQKALNTAAKYDYQSLYWPQVSVAAGTYPASIVFPSLKNPLRSAHTGIFGGWLVGDKGTPSNVVIGPVRGSGGECTWAFEGFELQGTALAGVTSERGAFIQPGTINHNGSFGTMWLVQDNGMLFGTNSGVCTIVSAGAGAVWLTMVDGGMVNFNQESHHLPATDINPISSAISAGPSGLNYITIFNIDWGPNINLVTGPKVTIGGGTIINTTNGLLSDIPGVLAGCSSDFSSFLMADENDLFTSNLSTGHAFPLLLSTKSGAGTPYVLTRRDAGGVVEMNFAGANQVTVPTSASMGATTFPLNTRITVVQVGVGATTVAAAGGVVVHNAGALAGQWSSCVLYQRAVDEWVQINTAF